MVVRAQARVEEKVWAVHVLEVKNREEGAMSIAAGRRGVWIIGPCTVPKRVATEWGATWW